MSVDDQSVTEWIREMRRRIHEHGNHITKLEGQMLGDRMVAEERHRHAESINQDIRVNLASLETSVSRQGEAMNVVVQGQQSILQTLDANERTRIETAAALEAADKARRNKENEPFVTANRVIALVLGLAAVLAYASKAGGIA